MRRDHSSVKMTNRFISKLTNHDLSLPVSMLGDFRLAINEAQSTLKHAPFRCTLLMSARISMEVLVAFDCRSLTSLVQSC